MRRSFRCLLLIATFLAAIGGGLTAAAEEADACAASFLRQAVADGLLDPRDADWLLANVTLFDTSGPGPPLPPGLDIKSTFPCGGVPSKNAVEIPFEGKKRTARCVVVWSSSRSHCPVYVGADDGNFVPTSPLIPVGEQRVVCAYGTGKTHVKKLLLFCSGKKEQGHCHVGADYLEDLADSPTEPGAPDTWSRNSGTSVGVCGQPVERDIVTINALREDAAASVVLKWDLCLLVQNTGSCPVKLRWHYEAGDPTAERLGAGAWTKTCNQELDPRRLTMECEGERGDCKLRWRVVSLGDGLSKGAE